MQVEISLPYILRQFEEIDQFSVTFIRDLKEGPRYYRIDLGKLNMPDGSVGVAMCFKDVDDEVQESLQYRQALEEKLRLQKQRDQQDKMITALASDYRSVYHVDLDIDEAVCYRADPHDPDRFTEGMRFPFHARFAEYGELYVDEQYREGFRRFIEPDNIRLALSAENIIANRYLAHREGVDYYEMLRMAGVRHPADRDDHIVHAVGIGFTVIDAEMRENMDRARALQEALSAAEQANRAKTVFLSNMSHELRTPINTILGMNEIIRNESSDKKILSSSENIRKAGTSLLGIISDILDFSKIEAGKMDIILVDYDFSSVINDLVHMIKPKAQGKGLDFVVDVDEKIPSILYGDEIRIKQVITNVLTNAVKYTEKGYVALNIQHEMASDDEVILKFMIKDTGIGIKEEDLGKLTEAFQRVDEVRNRSVEGTGLGLNITQKLLELMGSKLNVESNYGTGSIFSFDIRQKVIRNVPIGDYMEAYKKALIEQKKYHERFVAPDARVLVVDDTPINLDVFEGLLKTTKVKIDRAESGPECLEKTREKRYDIIFLDHRMPGMDGIETLKRLKEDDNNKNKGVPVICLTANAISGAREIYIRAGFDEYLTKPIMSEKLELLMTKFLPGEKVSIEITEVDADNQVNIEYDLLPHWIKNAPLIVLEEGIKNCGSQEAFVKAATTYRSNLEENYSAIKDAFENGDIENFTIKVHALKSSSRILGIYNLAELAEELEKAGDEKNIDFINKETPRLLNLYKDIWERMVSIPETEDEEAELPLMEEKAVEDAKNALRELAQSFDFDSINYIMETIKGFRVPDEHREFFKNMRAAILSADWDGIKKLLDAGGNDGQ
jgi:signal transduction histidine kinase/CheY-like chemotaxis protein